MTEGANCPNLKKIWICGTIKVRLKNQNMLKSGFTSSEKLLYISNGSTDLHEIWYNRMGSLTVTANVKNARWQTAAISKKNVKLWQLCNHLTNFDEICHDDAYWPPAADCLLKYRIFEKPGWQPATYWKVEKLLYLSNSGTDLDEIW